jgi:hypothetical protein
LIRWFGWEWSGIGQTFVESLLLLYAFVAIHCDIFKHNLIGVVLTYNFNLRKYKLMNLESSIGAFLLTVLYLIYLVITFIFHLFIALAKYQPVHLLSTNYKCT